MKLKNYSEPLCEVIELELESLLCESTPKDPYTEGIISSAPNGPSLFD